MANTGNEVSASDSVSEILLKEQANKNDGGKKPPTYEHYSATQKILSKCMSNLNQDIKIHQQLLFYNQVQLSLWIILKLIYVGLFSILFVAVLVSDAKLVVMRIKFNY
ncbi:unnamed protein product [Rotaria socialis]|uniref:Uncharacterized protein n=1 Tax=Rotaria socialis TaxID=392032 RepID=A0A817Y3H2_9BILA|nr:unnamed protein product [Rotaria socialis]